MLIGAMGDSGGVQRQVAATGGALQGGQTTESFALHVGAQADGAGGLDQLLGAVGFPAAGAPMGEKQRWPRRARIACSEIEIATERLPYLGRFLRRQSPLPQANPGYLGADESPIREIKRQRHQQAIVTRRLQIAV